MTKLHQRILFWVALVFMVVFVPPLLWRLPEQDEAMFLVQIKQVMQGQLPYRDFFQFTFPGTYSLALLMVPSVVLIRLVCLFFEIAAIACVDRLAKPYLSSPYRLWLILFLLLGVVGHYTTVSHHLLSGCLAVFAVTFFSSRPFLSGVLTAACMMTTQTLGLLLSMILKFDGKRWLGWLTMVVGSVGILIAFGIWPDFVRDTLQWSTEGHYAQTSQSGWYFATGLKELIHAGFTPKALGGYELALHQLPWLALVFWTAFLPLIGLGYGIWRCATNTADNTIKLLTVATALMLISTLTYSTGAHIAMNGWLGMLLATLAIQHLLTCWDTTGLLAKATVLKLCFLVGGLILLQLNVQALPMLTEANWIHSYGTLEPAFYQATPDDLKQQSKIVETTRAFACQGEPIFVYNASPQLYLLTDRPNASRYQIIYPTYTSTAQQAEILQALVKRPPHVMIDDHKAYWMVRKDPRFAVIRSSGKPLPTLSWLDHFAAQNYRRVRLNAMADVLILNNRKPPLK